MKSQNKFVKALKHMWTMEDAKESPVDAEITGLSARMSM
ncbi:hypothetical protein Uis1B_1966 [Bifidobacterium margollesii]|uniref:Uncharacterized protein n=1 Tax=Bifidobacterium margollesii TaxID=2020964 RepID=A0A2N5J7J8_9BIFI|nr:hypothetical protein Uis1B_1966 [Bifidobacterium margollesii]